MFGPPNLSEEIEDGEEFGPWKDKYLSGTRNSNVNLDTIASGIALISLEEETLQIYYNRFGTKHLLENKPKAFLRGPLTKRMRRQGCPLLAMFNSKSGSITLVNIIGCH